jgi:hypothetical protein
MAHRPLTELAAAVLYQQQQRHSQVRQQQQQLRKLQMAGSYAAASDLQGDVAAAGDSCKQTAAALPDGRASHKLQAQPKHARFSDSIKRTEAFEAFEPRPHPGLAGDSVADAVSPFEMHGAAYGDLLQVHQCSVSE